MNNDTADVLFDDYLEEGNDLASFQKAIRNHAARTEFEVIFPSNISFLSFHKIERFTDENGDKKKSYIFFVIDRQGLTDERNTKNAIHTTPLVTVNENDKESELERLIKHIKNTTGLLLLNTDEKGKQHYYGISGYAMSTLCRRAGMGGERIHEPSLFRDCYIADGIILTADKNASARERKRSDTLFGDGITIVYRKRLKYKLRGKPTPAGNIGMIYAAFSGNYKPFNTELPLNLYKEIVNRKSLGETTVKHWQIDQGITAVTIEFPEKAKELAKKYKLKTPLIPGLTITTSDCGLSSLSMRGTLRAENGSWRDHLIVEKTSFKHQGFPTVEEEINNLEKTVFPAYEEYIAKFAAVQDDSVGRFDTETATGRQRRKEAIKTAAMNALTHTGIKDLVGKKKCAAIADEIYEEFRSSDFNIGRLLESILHNRTLMDVSGNGDDEDSNESYVSGNDYTNSMLNRIRTEVAKTPFVAIKKEKKEKTETETKQVKAVVKKAAKKTKRG